MKRVEFGGFYANLYYDLAHQYFESILKVIFISPPKWAVRPALERVGCNLTHPSPDLLDGHP